MVIKMFTLYEGKKSGWTFDRSGKELLLTRNLEMIVLKMCLSKSDRTQTIL